MKSAKEVSPVTKTIATKQKLIVRLNKEIGWAQDRADTEIQSLRFRIKMAQTLVDALKKGQ